MRDRDCAGGDHRGAAGRRAAGGVVGVPGVARDVDGRIVRRAADPEFRRGGAPDQIEPGPAHLPGHERVGGSAIAAHVERAHFLQAALHCRTQILHQERKSGKWPVEIGAVRAGVCDRILENLDDAGKLGVDLGDGGGRLRGQFHGRQFALRDACGQRNAVMVSPFLPAHRQVHSVGPSENGSDL